MFGLSPAVLLTVLGIFFFSLKGILVKLAYDAGADPLSFLYLRMVFAGFFYILIFFFVSIPEGLKRRDHLSIAVLGIVGYFLASGLDFWGLSFISAGMERLIIYLYPTLILLIEWFLFGKTPNAGSLSAVALCYVGLIFVLLGGDPGTIGMPGIWSGAVLVFLSGLCYAVFLIGSQSYLGKFGTLPFTTLSMIWASGTTIVFYAMARRTLSVGHLSPHVYLDAIFVAIFTTVLPSYLVSYGVSRLGAQKTSLLGALGPVSTLFVSYLALDERLTWLEWIGTSVILAGVLWAQGSISSVRLKISPLSPDDKNRKSHSP